MERVDLRCLLDDDNVVVEANSPSAICSSEGVVGINFLEAITDLSLRGLYQMIVDRVRQTGQSMRFSLRCDTPEFKRLAFVRFNRLEQDGIRRVEVLNGTLNETPYAVPLSLLDGAAPRGTELLLICSWCKQVKLADNRWVEVETAMQELHLFHRAVVPGLSHGMCRTCAERVKAEFARQIAQPNDSSGG